MNSTDIRRIPLWCAFLPLSLLVVLIMISVRWAKRGMTWFDPHWTKTSLLAFLGGIGAMLPFFFVSLLLGGCFGADSTLWLCSKMVIDYLSITAASLVVREIDYRRLVKVCKK